MKTSSTAHHGVVLAVLFAVVGWTVLGCSRDDKAPGASVSHQASSQTHKQAAIRVGQLFGKYMVTDYAHWSGAMHEERDARARGHLDDEGAILPEVFALRSIVVLNPRYEIRDYPRLLEGEVPMGLRRRLSDFYGAGRDRNAITVLEVYEAGAASPRCHVEVLDENTLWDTWNGPWVFEWRREGTKANPIPLKDRCLGGGNR